MYPRIAFDFSFTMYSLNRTNRKAYTKINVICLISSVADGCTSIAIILYPPERLRINVVIKIILFTYFEIQSTFINFELQSAF
jgi:hypothetical protein